VARRGLISNPLVKKMAFPESPMKTITVPELLTKNIKVLELPMKKFLIQIPEKQLMFPESRYFIMQNSPFLILVELLDITV
jgi:hypothetical protein